MNDPWLPAGISYSDLTRGERNRNPGNLRHGVPWLGLAVGQTDPAFCQFIDSLHGIRALALNLLNYQRLHGLGTLQDIVARWAPPSENDTAAYVAGCARDMGVDPYTSLVLTDAPTLQSLTRAIIHHENGRVLYSDENLAAAVASALQVTR